MGLARMHVMSSILNGDAETPRVKFVIVSLSLAVCLAVALIVYGVPSQRASGGPSLLAQTNAVLNASAAVFLATGFVFIRRKNVSAHRACMLTAFVISCAFLVSYLVHHAQVGSVRYQGVGLMRAVYFGLLVPHIVLAALVLPLALLTIYRGLTGRFVKHKRIARITFPIWLFVSASGVVLYFMLYHS